MLCLGPNGEVLDGGGQRLDFFGLSLVGSCEDSDLCPECGDVLQQGNKAGCHRGLYLCQSVFQVVVAVV